MFALVQHTPLCGFALLAVLLFLGVQALRRRNVRLENRDADLIEEIRLMAEAELDARHLVADAGHPSRTS